MKIELDDKTVRHLEKLLEYCHEERLYYEGCDRPRDHVYRHIRALWKIIDKAHEDLERTDVPARAA
jgi:hypothetical protein